MNSVPLLFFLWAKRFHTDAIHSVMHQVHGDACFVKPTVHAWWKKMLVGQKFASGTDLQLVILQWLGQQRTSFFAWGIQKLGNR